ncbi:MAG: tyrosine-type recombinase/integrase, partial [Kosmotogaceae bacterium]
MNRHNRRASRRLYVREQLTGYGSVPDQEIPYSDQYTQFMVIECNYRPATAKINLDMVKEFHRFLKLEYGLDRFDPLQIEPSHVRRYLVYLNNELNNSPGTRNRKLSALGSYYLFLECFEYIDEDQNPISLISRAKTSRSLPVVLNLEEAQSILRVSSYGLHGERNLAIMRVMLQTALRVEELVKLTKSDLDLEEKILKVKDDEIKDARIQQELNIEVKEQLTYREKNDSLLAIALDSANEFLGFVKLAQGTVNRAAVYPRALVSFLLVETNATAVVLAH